MTGKSLRLRFALLGALLIGLATALALFGLLSLFTSHLERSTMRDMSWRIDQLIAALDIGPDQKFFLRSRPNDPRFAQPFSGLYWQIETGDQVLRSRSLWDFVLQSSQSQDDSLGEGALTIPGPDGTPLIALERQTILPRSLGERPIRLVVARVRAEIDASRRDFIFDMLPYAGLFSLFLIAGGWLLISVGLRPLTSIGAKVSDIRQGSSARLGHDYPSEVNPLAEEIDALLDQRHEEIEKARSRAADLAHGFKTPLQALIGISDRQARAGDHETAHHLEEIGQSMQRLVDRELTRTRLAALDKNSRASLSDVIRRLINVMGHMPDGARLDWSVDISDDTWVIADPDDLSEAFGALLENAARHALSKVHIRATIETDTVTLVIADDGPGIPHEARSALMDRGARLDESGEGTGLGLAISREIITAFNGEMTLSSNQPSGLVVSVTLPVPHADR